MYFGQLIQKIEISCPRSHPRIVQPVFYLAQRRRGKSGRVAPRRDRSPRGYAPARQATPDIRQSPLGRDEARPSPETPRTGGCVSSRAAWERTGQSPSLPKRAVNKRICLRPTPLPGTWSVHQFARICVDLWFIFPWSRFTDCTIRGCAHIAQSRIYHIDFRHEM